MKLANERFKKDMKHYETIHKREKNKKQNQNELMNQLEKEMLEKALRRFLHAKMFAAWNMWRSWAEEMRRQEYVMRGALRRMQNRLLSMAFEKWQYEAAKMKQLQERGDAVRYHGQIGRSQTHYTVDDFPLMRRVFAEDLWPILKEIVCFLCTTVILVLCISVSACATRIHVTRARARELHVHMLAHAHTYAHAHAHAFVRACARARTRAPK